MIETATVQLTVPLHVLILRHGVEVFSGEEVFAVLNFLSALDSHSIRKRGKRGERREEREEGREEGEKKKKKKKKRKREKKRNKQIISKIYLLCDTPAAYSRLVGCF